MKREKVERSIYRCVRGFYVYVNLKLNMIWRGPFATVEDARAERDRLVGTKRPSSGISIVYCAPSLQSKPWRLRIKQRHIGYFPTWDDAWAAARAME